MGSASTLVRQVSTQGSVVTLPTVRLPAVGTVDVWTFELGSWEDESALSAQEEIASTRFRFDRDRVRFRRRRAHYRSALSRYAGMPAAALQFTTNAFGKPSLAGVDALWFSASSREDLAVLAVSRHQVGIDVEVVRPERADIEVAQVPVRAGGGRGARVRASSRFLPLLDTEGGLRQGHRTRPVLPAGVVRGGDRRRAASETVALVATPRRRRGLPAGGRLTARPGHRHLTGRFLP